MPGSSNASLTALGVRRQRQKNTILVAEDCVDAREMIQILLETKGYAVVTVGDGPAAVAVAVQALPDLMLIDLELPRLDGLAVARELRRHSELHHIPIIMMSGHDASTYRRAALDAGCDDYLGKPIDFDHLDQILRERIPAHIEPARLAGLTDIKRDSRGFSSQNLAHHDR